MDVFRPLCFDSHSWSMSDRAFINTHFQIQGSQAIDLIPIYIQFDLILIILGIFQL